MKKPSPDKAMKKAAKKIRAKKARKKDQASQAKRNPAGSRHSAERAPATYRFSDEDRVALARLAEGVWRLERRAEEPWAKNLVEYFGDSLRELDVEIIDRKGTSYLDGETIEVLHSDAPEGSTDLVIKETIRPTVKVGGRIVQPGQVVLE